MEAVVNGVIPLHVPAIVVLIDAIAMNPNYRWMLFGAVKVLGYKYPCGHRLTIGTEVADGLRFYEYGSINVSGHGVGEPYWLRPRSYTCYKKIRRVSRVGVLVDEAL